MRRFLFVISALQFLLAIGFALQIPLVTALWVFPGTTALTYIFIASIFVAAAASQTWVALTKQWGALAGIGLDYVGILTPAAVYSAMLGASEGNSGFFTYSIVCVGGTLFGAALWWWSRRYPLDTTIPVPPLVRWSFVIFVGALFIASFQLVRQVPHIIPWTITPELSVLIGWFFFGAALYFIYGVVRPGWANAGGQLAGFLAYDVVLIVPFLTRLPTVPPEIRLSLWIYTAVVTYSGILATYYLFIHPTTHIVNPPPAAALP